MLGNDSIDLKLALQQSNWKRPGYLFKIFSIQEQKMVDRADNPDLIVWLIWSMKEATYKIVNRRTGIRLYNPWEFSCSFEINHHQTIGKVKYKQETFLCATEITPTFLHTLAVQNDLSFNQIKVIHGLNTPDYVQAFNQNETTLRLIRNSMMLPEIYSLKNKSTHMASVSHHGNILSIAYLK